jgi:hypothetical protein
LRGAACVDTGRVGITSASPATYAVSIPPERLDDFRLMLREQVVDDTERLRDIDAGYDSSPREPVQERLEFVWSLARLVGGIY